MNVWSRASVLFGATVALLLAAVGGINAVVDPYNITRLATIKGINGFLPTLVYQSALSKALGLRRETVDTLLLGSSVVDAGFAVPGSTLFDGNRLTDQSKLSGKGVYNSGIRGAGVDAALLYLRHAHAQNPGLKHVVLGLEWGLFTSLIRPYTHRDAFLDSDPWWRLGYFKYLTWTALDDSVRTVQANQGFSYREGFRDLSRLWNTPVGAGKEQVTMNSTLPINARTSAETRAIYFTIYQGTTFRQLADRDPTALANKKHLDTLREIVEYTRQNNIKLTVYVSPQHAAYWATMKKLGLWPYHLEWLRQLAQITPYFDFSALVDFSDDADALFPSDPLHFSLASGARILPFLLGQKESKDANYVTRDTVGDAVTRRSQRLDDWRQRNTYVDAVLSSIRLPPKQVGMDDILPVGLRGSENGLKVVKFAGEYFGLPANQEPYDLRRVVTRQYAPMAVADTPAAVKAEIERRHLRTFELVRMRPSGKPIGSDGDAGRAFDQNGATFWMTALPDDGRAWVGYAFDKPVSVRRIVVVQNPNPAYRHDKVMVQSSQDGGVSWHDALPPPQNLFERDRGVINIPESAGAATHWRIIAPAAQPLGPKVVWLVYELEFYTADSSDAASRAPSNRPDAPIGAQ